MLNTCVTFGELFHFSKSQFHQLQDKVNNTSLLDCDKGVSEGEKKVNHAAESGDSYRSHFPEEASLRQPAG